MCEYYRTSNSGHTGHTCGYANQLLRQMQDCPNKKGGYK